MAKTVTQKLYKVECDPACGFLIRNHNEVELVPIVITHCLNTHNQVQTAEQVRGMIRAA